VVTDLVYLEQYPYIKIGWVYIKSTYNYCIVYKFSKLDLLILVDFVVSNKSF
jgi:hypothetical protein